MEAGATTRRPLRRHATSALGPIGLCALGFTLIAAVVVRTVLVDPGFYLDALDDNNAYERTYSEVLSDPEFAAVTERLIGELGLSPATSRSVRVVSTHALRLTIPPSTLREGVESFVVQVLDYVRSEEGALRGEVDVAVVAGRILESVLAQLSARIAQAAQTVATTATEYEEAISAFADQLATGVVPEVVPVLGGTEFDPNDVVDIILAELGDRADEQLRQQVRAAVLAGSQRDALVAAGSAFVADHAQRISAELRSDAISARYVDVLQRLADRSGVEEEAIAARLATIRTAVWWLRLPTAVAGGLLIAAGLASLVRLHGRDLLWLGRSLAVCGVVSGVAVGAVWLLVGALVEPPLAPATSTGPGSWNLPAGLRHLVGDVEASLADGLDDVVRRLIVTPVVGGLVLLATTVVLPHVLRLRPRQLAMGAAGTATAAVAAVWLVPSAPGIDPNRACNGYVELCDRPYDEVVFPATHNAMSSPDVVRLWPEQDLDLREQLDSGVRALLLDTHYWTPLRSGSQLTTGDEPLPEPLAEQLVGLVGARAEPRDGVYLCHSHCALGARLASQGLRQVRQFLEQNPHEVVTLIIQDGTRRSDTIAAFERAEIGDYLYAHERGEPWPTLGELIDSGRRLVVFSEVYGPPPDWFHKAFEHIQDTPFLVSSPEDLDCRYNRGPRNAPLFLMNHWIRRNAPDRAVAATVNRYDVIVERARRCEQERGQLPSFIAVNFSNIGDLMAAVDTLNGVSRRPSTR